jgi:hypothetical protein
LESPFEIEDYARAYLGDNRNTLSFVKKFLLERSKYVNMSKQKNNLDDDLLAPARAKSFDKMKPAKK